MAIDIHNLRVGNFVSASLKQYTVVNVYKDGTVSVDDEQKNPEFTSIQMHSEFLFGIPLSHEWMLKLGFDEEAARSTVFSKVYILYDHYYLWFGPKTEWQTNLVYASASRNAQPLFYFSYVHEMQNFLQTLSQMSRSTLKTRYV